MIPVIALIGRRNVGKSTIFNRLTRTRDALVADLAGLTRDRNYGYAEWKGYKFIVIDTGGFNSVEDEIEIHIVRQSLIAIREANIILFIVDGSTGLVTTDQNIAKYLHQCSKKIIIVVNKTDGIDICNNISDFYTLGADDVLSIAALHGRGINNLIDKILLLAKNKQLEKCYIENENKIKYWFNSKLKIQNRRASSLQLVPIKLAIVGRPNVGKSTLVNCLLGEERMVVYGVPGTTRNSIYIPLTYKRQDYILIDTAGIRKRSALIEKVEKFSAIKTMQAIENADVVLLVIDAYEGISNQDLSLLNFIINSGRSLVIAINKWDLLSSKKRFNTKRDLDKRLTFINFVYVNFISALYGSGIKNLFNSVNKAYHCSMKRVNTALLTRIMHMAIDEHQPPLVHGRRIKPKYAHAGGYNPLVVVIHGTQVKELPNSYKRYLINYFNRSLKIIGTPIRIRFNETVNPFTNQHSKTTLIQKYKSKLR